MYFDELPAGWESADAMVLQALRVGFQMGTQSPSAQGLVQYINTTQAEKIADLQGSIEEATDGLKSSVEEAFASGEACTAKGFGSIDGECVALPWVVTSKEPECTDDNAGALRYAVDDGGLLVCAGANAGWTAVSPPAEGKSKTSPGESCAALQAAGLSTGSGLYWLAKGGGLDIRLGYCNMQGDGVELGDGSAKAYPAPSCFQLQQYYGVLSDELQRFWIGDEEEESFCRFTGFEVVHAARFVIGPLVWHLLHACWLEASMCLIL
jgi:hypothetical protein